MNQIQQKYGWQIEPISDRISDLLFPGLAPFVTKILKQEKISPK